MLLQLFTESVCIFFTDNICSLMCILLGHFHKENDIIDLVL